MRSLRYGLTVVACIIWIGLPVWVLSDLGIGGLEKLLTAYAMPVGLIWNLLILSSLASSYHHKTSQAMGYLGFAIMIYLFGTVPLGWSLSRLIEPDIPTVFPSEEKYDAVVLLGGSTRQKGEVAELASDGQRLMLATQLYHAGRTRHIIATGGLPVVALQDMPHSEQSRRLLQSVGVPADAITTLGGENTREEMARLAQHFSTGAQSLADSQVGLITNAAHMPRAIRLAGRSNLDFIPLPCVFNSSGSIEVSIFNMIPSAHGLLVSTTACYEILARLAGQ